MAIKEHECAQLRQLKLHRNITISKYAEGWFLYSVKTAEYLRIDYCPFCGIRLAFTDTLEKLIADFTKEITNAGGTMQFVGDEAIVEISEEKYEELMQKWNKNAERFLKPIQEKAGESE